MESGGIFAQNKKRGYVIGFFGVPTIYSKSKRTTKNFCLLHKNWVQTALNYMGVLAMMGTAIKMLTRNSPTSFSYFVWHVLKIVHMWMIRYFNLLLFSVF